MSGEAWLYLFAVLINAVNLFLQVFFTIMYSDLEWCVPSPPPPLFNSGLLLRCLLVACPRAAILPAPAAHKPRFEDLFAGY